jgi:hypothetical protein
MVVVHTSTINWTTIIKAFYFTDGCATPALLHIPDWLIPNKKVAGKINILTYNFT